MDTVLSLRMVPDRGAFQHIVGCINMYTAVLYRLMFSFAIDATTQGV
jgi:hypothetical protein